MQLDKLKDTKIHASVSNDYCTDLGAETLLHVYTDETDMHLINISNIFELELFKENLEEILKHVTEAYNYTKGFNI